MSNLPSSLLCDDLFLLVGTNPLPNWVVTQLLVKKSSGCVHLAYTSGVSEQARRLQAVLKAEGFQVSLLQTAESDEQRIFDDVRRRAEALLKQSPDRKIGLNYTGGTKMMSVHAHRAVLKANLPEPILSYLDARSLRLKFDQHPPQGWSIALAPDVRISIKKLLRLHDLKVARKLCRSFSLLKKQWLTRTIKLQNRCTLRQRPLHLPAAYPRIDLASLIQTAPQRFWSTGRLSLVYHR